MQWFYVVAGASVTLFVCIKCALHPELVSLRALVYPAFLISACTYGFNVFSEE